MLFALTNCGDELPVVKENIFSAEDNTLAETHFFATFEAAYDVITTDDRFGKTRTTIIPSDATIEFIDSSFDDGDGVEVIVDFGELLKTEPRGKLCQDGRYRAGKMLIHVNQSVQSAEFRATVTMCDEDQFYSGNGVDMAQLTGTTVISLVGISIRVLIKDARIIYEDNEIHWSSDRIITQLKSAGEGIWGDTYAVTGSASGVNREGDSFEVAINEPLIKVMEKGCSRTFLEGQLTVTANNSSKVIYIDYDPYKNRDCDLYAEAVINGKKLIFKVN